MSAEDTNVSLDDKDDKDDKGDKEEKLDIEVEDDTPEEDQGREARADGVEPDLPNEEEVKKYSKRAQQRIKHVKWEFNEERRSKESAERIRDQAVDFARGQHNELVRLRHVLARGEADLVSTSKTGSEARLESSRASLRSANESGDSEAIAKAQEEMSRAVIENTRWKDYQPQHQLDQADPRMRPVQRQPAAEPAPPRITPTPEAEEWADRNSSWFNRNARMTTFVNDFHTELVKTGVEVDSDDYYKKLDKEMVRVFPSAFQSEDSGQSRQKAAPAQKATVVASSSRSEGTPRKVRLTQSQVALAKRLGISSEAYARELLKQQETGE